MAATTQRKRGSQAVNDRARIMRRDFGICQTCYRNGITTLAYQVDHIIALSNGGSDDDSNKQAICKPCHDAKTRQDKGHSIGAACDTSGIPASPLHHWNSK